VQRTIRALRRSMVTWIDDPPSFLYLSLSFDHIG
jgi:hypothetical protein